MQKPFNAKQIHILNVVEEFIAQNGFEDTSVREISKKANINVAMISYYFGSKEKMMTCLYEYRILANFRRPKSGAFLPVMSLNRLKASSGGSPSP